MKHVRQLVGDFGVEKNTLTNFLKREIKLNYSPNFLDLNCDEDYIAVAGTSNSKPSITVYNIEGLVSQVSNYTVIIVVNFTVITTFILLQNNISPVVSIDLDGTPGSHVVDMSWNPGVQSSLACCLSDGSLYIIELKDGGTYCTVNLPPQSNTLYENALNV